jgi:hypothetical protein
VTSESAKLLTTSLNVMPTDTLEPALTEVEATVAVGRTSSAGASCVLAREVAGDPLVNVAVTVKLYKVPFVSPVTVQVSPVVVQVFDSGDDVAVYPVTVPPSGASHETFNWPDCAGLERATVTLLGALLTSAVTVALARPVNAPTVPQFSEYSTR